LIGEKEFEFDPGDPIFFRQDAVKPNHPLANCRVCGNETREKKLI
jgi:hypothetical protein